MTKPSRETFDNVDVLQADREPRGTERCTKCKEFIQLSVLENMCASCLRAEKEGR